MSTRRAFLKTVGVGTVAAAGLTTTATATGKSGVDLFAPLTSGQTVPKAQSRATGTATFTENTSGVLDFELTLKNIENVTQAHVHVGKRGETGGVVFPLAVFNTEVDGSGIGIPQSGTPQDPIVVFGTVGDTTVSPAADFLANPAEYYVNVHTVDNPSGEIRGQLRAK